DEHAEILGGFAETSMSDRVAQRRSVSGGSPDEAIADAVRRELARDASTEALELDVDVDRGIVTLSGRVSDLADSDNALAVAGRVPGVVDVVDGIEVEAGAER
ncbi:MAG TPA: BON domain-containing protein, partial [Candidatus Limnocylindria bacterium]